jgi:DNA-binding NarL/FixJ family response regulator
MLNNTERKDMKQIFTYVSPKTNHEVANGLCSQLPIVLESYNQVEELFPLLSDPTYYTNFVVICIEMFHQRTDIDMFDIIQTLATLIKSTVYRNDSDIKPQKRNTKIIVVVDENTDPVLIRQVAQFTDIASIGWVLKKPEEFDEMIKYIERLISGDYSHHPKVLELLKPKKKIIVKNNDISLTSRQTQILKLIRDRGASNKTIARLLNISESTVKLHLGNIFKKYGVKNRTQLALFSNQSSQ